MKCQLSDREKVTKLVRTEVREIEITMTFNPREAMILKDLLGQIWSDNGVGQVREFTDSIYWRLADFGLPALAKSPFAFEHDGIKALTDLECHLYGEGECQRRLEANRDYIKTERDAGRLVSTYKLPYSPTSGV